MVGTHIIRQNTFGAGELVPEIKRSDSDLQQRSGARQMENWRLMASRKPTPRPGRRARFPQAGRTETVLLPGNIRFSVSFGNGTLVIRDANDAIVASNTGYPWTTATVGSVSFAVVNSDILVCFPGMVPRFARRSPVDGSWSFQTFAFATGYQGEYRAPFYRFQETLGITMLPSAQSGSITLTTSGPIFYAGHVGAVFRFKKCQILITSVTSTTQAKGTVLQPLPPAQILTVANTSGFLVGQVITGNTSNGKGEVTAVTSTAVTVQLAGDAGNFVGFSANETIISPISRTTISAIASASLQASVEWDEIVMSGYRGWPAACAFDRLRVSFINFPQLPEGIAWSAVSSYADFLVGSDASSAMFELVPGRVQVKYLTGGPDQFVFTDRGVFYIPISESSPLAPGSVEFVRITPDGCGPVQPVATPDALIYVNAGMNRLIGIIQTGAVTRPYAPQDLTEWAYHLVKTPVCLAAVSDDPSFPEHYVFCVNADGSMFAGLVDKDKRWTGFTPWTGAGLVRWVSSLAGMTLLNVDYAGTATSSIVEAMDDTVDMDGQFTLAAPPSALAGTGPLWMWAGMTVDIMDQGVDYGRRAVDAAGNIVTVSGDAFSSATLVVGQAYTAVLEPFVPSLPEGTDMGQTQRRRRIISGAVTVRCATGFTWMGKEIPAVFWGEEGGAAPTQREDTFKGKQLGRKFDPSAVLTVPRPSDIVVVEIALEVTD